MFALVCSCTCALQHAQVWPNNQPAPKKFTEYSLLFKDVKVNLSNETAVFLRLSRKCA